MPWTSAPGAGFTTGTPWLRLGPDATTHDVATELADPDSVLACYRRLIAARRAEPSLQDGRLRLRPVGDPDVLGFRRLGSGPDVLVGIAFGAAGGRLDLPRRPAGGGWRPIVGSHRELPVVAPGARSVELRGFEGLVLVATP